MKRAQTYLDPRLKPHRQGFGGSLDKKSHAKTARPISTKHAIHLVLRSSKAKGARSFLYNPHRSNVDRLIRKFCDRYGVKLYMLGFGYNHIHFQIRVTNRFTWKPFIRGLTAAIAMSVTGTAKTRALKEKFWDNRPWTRVMDWGKAYWAANRYMIMNEMESARLIPYQPRNEKRRLELITLRSDTA
ncbi:MAG: transposase [Bdellovibrionia bacterium]